MTALGVLLILASPTLAWIEATATGASSPGCRWLAIPVAILGTWASFWRFISCAGRGLRRGRPGSVGYAVLHLNFIDPNFWALVDENAQYVQMIEFSDKYLPPNYGSQRPRPGPSNWRRVRPNLARRAALLPATAPSLCPA